MDLSLVTLLTTASIGDLKLGAMRGAVVGTLGEPLHWEGKSQLAANDSPVWQYGPLQINFDAASKVDTFRLHFTVHVENRRAWLETDFSPFDFEEAFEEDFAELAGFERFLENHNIEHSRSKNRVGHTTVVCGASSITTFRERVDHDLSVALERRIVVPGERIVSCAVSTDDAGLL